MKNKLSGLSDFKITGASLLKSSKEVLVEVSFRHIDYKRVLNYTPEERVRLREGDRMAKIDNFIKKHVKRGYKNVFNEILTCCFSGYIGKYYIWAVS